MVGACIPNSGEPSCSHLFPFETKRHFQFAHKKNMQTVFTSLLRILQRIEELDQLLPPESTLYDAYGVHPKYITEMENRLKFCLRHAVQ